MKRVSRVSTVVAALFLLVFSWLLPLPVGADTAPTPALSFREVKITGDEFVVVRASQAIPDLSAYWLGYSSNDAATNIVPTQQLPAIALASGQAVLLTSDAAQTCDAVYTSKLSVSLSDTKGALQLRQLISVDKNTSSFTTIDSVNWTKPSATDKTPVTDNLDLRKESGVTLPVWYHDASAAGAAWTVGNFANCSLSVAAQTGATTAPAQTYSWPSSAAGPPAVILSLDLQMATPSDSSLPAAIPTGDAGLAPPQISEVLPNPLGTGNDASDEFIELYNPNAKPFDLSGFSLETGLTTKHNYTFPAATILAANGFTAFYSADTGLSLSNTSGAADLLDPLGALLSQTDPYGTAKDGQAWALANGNWYWTLQPTPGAANTIDQGTTAKTTTAGTTAVKAASTAKASTKKAATAKVAKAKTTKAVKATKAKTATTLPAKTVAATTPALNPIHPWTLAAVAGLALAYGIYEYRLDLANLVHKFQRPRRHRALG